MSVTIYSQTTCGPCKMLKSFLEGNDISYTEKLVDKNDADLEELKAMGFNSTPVTIIGDTHIVGFNPEKIEEALA